MADWQRLTATEQLTAHLRGELLRGRWVGTMPGVQRLAAEFSDNCKTAEFIEGGTIGPVGGSLEVGKLGSWEVGKLGSWEVGKSGSREVLA